MTAAHTEPPIQSGPPPARTVRLATGRVVGYYEYGDPRGAPLFVLHGTPLSDAGFPWAARAARERGLRLIAPDRPGVGLSDRAPVPLVAHYGAELGATADALGIDPFGVLGYSGGGPPALAAAYALPERVSVAGVVAGMGPTGAVPAHQRLAERLSASTRVTAWPGEGHFALVAHIEQILDELRSSGSINASAPN